MLQSKGLARWRHYFRWKIFTIFVVNCSLENVWKPPLHQYAGTLAVMQKIHPKRKNMKSIRTILIITLLFVTLGVVNGQGRTKPKIIKATTEYVNPATHFLFPVSLFDYFHRKDICSFDRKKNNIGVTYEKIQNGEKTTFTLYMYPAGAGYEGRLRGEYKKALHSAFITMKKENLEVTQTAIQHKGEKYICNGFKAIFTNDSDDLSQLTVFESGTWFYKIRITSNRKDTTFFNDLEAKIVQTFDPTHLTELKLLKGHANIYMLKSAFRDDFLLVSALASAWGKTAWALQNVDTNERATGFPDLYLNLHVKGLTSFLEFKHQEEYKKSPFTERYVNELWAIYNAGFLPEFVMEQYDKIMIIPENTEFRYGEYFIWKSEKKISIDLREKLYIISYDPIQ